MNLIIYRLKFIAFLSINIFGKGILKKIRIFGLISNFVIAKKKNLRTHERLLLM